MKKFQNWARKQIDNLTKKCEFAQLEQNLFADVCYQAGDIAQEAGIRAGKLGLADLHDETVDLIGGADPYAVQTFLAKCIQACQVPKSDDDLLTVDDVANRLNVAPRTAYRLCEEGQLPHRHVGSGRGTIRVRPEDLAAFERKTEEQAKPKNRITLAQLREA